MFSPFLWEFCLSTSLSPEEKFAVIWKFTTRVKLKDVHNYKMPQALNVKSQSWNRSNLYIKRHDQCRLGVKQIYNFNYNHRSCASTSKFFNIYIYTSKFRPKSLLSWGLVRLALHSVASLSSLHPHLFKIFLSCVGKGLTNMVRLFITDVFGFLWREGRDKKSGVFRALSASKH